MSVTLPEADLSERILLEAGSNVLHLLVAVMLVQAHGSSVHQQE